MNYLYKLFLILFLLFQQASQAQCLSGTYTIGGTNPDYASVADAATALATNGVCGPVTFNLRPAVYTETVTILPVPGASDANPILFKSENNDATTTTITSNAAFTIDLNGADHIQFSQLTFSNSNLTGVAVIQLENDADHNKIIKCTFSSSSWNSTVTCIRSLSETNDSLIIQNSYFASNYRGISIGNKLTGCSGTYIGYNTFSNMNYSAILINNADVQIVGNTLFENTSAPFSGIEITNSTQKAIITNNIIRSFAYGVRGINISDCAFTNALISNNFFRSSASDLTIVNSKNINVYHNTFRDSSSFAIVRLSGTLSGIAIKNNIFIQDNNGWIYEAASFNGVSCDDNVLSANEYIYSNSTTSKKIASLIEFTDLTGQDPHSTETAPEFKSDLDAHIAAYTGITPLCLYYPETARDMDGDQRSTNHPFYGADEFTGYTPYVNDAGIIGISHGKDSILCNVNNVISIQVRNYGLANLTSAIIKWAVNGISQPDVTWTGNLGNDVTTIVLNANYNFDIKQYYKIDAAISSVNSTVDQNTKNNTISGNRFKFGMHGDYTIGGSTPDYSTLAEAVTDLKKYGVCTAVNFLIRPGTYMDTVYLDAPVTGTSSTNSITFQSSTGNKDDVLIRSLSGKPIVAIYQVSYVSFNNLRFKNDLLGAYNVQVKFSSMSTNLFFKNCDFQAASGNVFLNGGEQFDSFENCTFKCDSLQNIYVKNSKNVNITDCYFQAPNGYAIICEGAQNVDILNNSFKSCSGLILSSSSDFLKVEHNVTDSVGYTKRIPVQFLYCGNISFNYNKLSSGSSKSTSDKQILYFSNCMTGTNRVMNNLIQQPLTASKVNALYATYVKNTVFYHNTIVGNTSDVATATAYFDRMDNCTIKNNIINSSGKGMAIALRTSTNIVSDNNDLFTKQGTNLGLYNNSTCSNLSKWQLQTVMDDQSVSVDPTFVSDTDLHIKNALLKQTGANIGSLVPVDLDGNSRNLLKPDIGAYVYSKFKTDAGLTSFNNLSGVCDGPFPLTVQLKNFGTTAIQTISLNYTVNNSVQPTKNLTLNLAPQADTVVELGTISFQSNLPYTIKAWCTNPNGDTDSIQSNDTLLIPLLRTGLKGTYTIGGLNPDYPTIQTAIKDLMTWGVCDSVQFKIRDGIYKERFSITSIPGASSTHRISFRSESNDPQLVQIVADTNALIPFMISLKNIHSFAFENMSFISAQSAESIIRIEETCSNLIFRNCSFKKQGSRLDNCILIANGISGLYLNANTFDGNGVNFMRPTRAVIDSISIENNIFLNYTLLGISCTSGKNIHLVNNKFSSSISDIAATAISLKELKGNFTVERNKISGYHTGLYLLNCIGDSAKRAAVVNNMINMTGLYGMYTEGLMYTNILQNTVHISGNTNGAVALVSGKYSSVSNLNNIYSCAVNSGFVLMKSLADSLNIYSDYNDYYSSGTYFAKWLTTNISTLADLQTISKQEKKSLSVDPLFKSTTDLHILDNNAFLNGTGTPLAGTGIDIDGDLRGTPPDIGADEYVYVPPTALDPSSSENKPLSAYPNPFSGSTYIRYSADHPTFIRLQLFNNTGQLIHLFTEEVHASGNYQLKLDAHSLGLKNGLYFLQFTDDKTTFTVKLLLSE